MCIQLIFRVKITHDTAHTYTEFTLDLFSIAELLKVKVKQICTCLIFKNEKSSAGIKKQTYLNV